MTGNIISLPMKKKKKIINRYVIPNSINSDFCKKKKQLTAVCDVCVVFFADDKGSRRKKFLLLMAGPIRPKPLPPLTLMAVEVLKLFFAAPLIGWF